MKFLFVLLLLTAHICHAQTDIVRYKAGAELIKFNKVHSLGAHLEFAGMVLTLASTATITTDLHTTAFIAAGGTILSLVGYVVEATSYKHIKRAGIILEGIGISIPLDHRKKHRY